MFVTVGNATQGFMRLLNAVDEAAGRGLFRDEPVFIQTGNNPTFRASNCQQEAFLDMPRFEALLKDANMVIAHGGSGTLINLLQVGKIPVVMPRRRQYGEHVDDHQVELVKALAKEGRVIPLFEEADLEDGLKEAKQRNGQVRTKRDAQLVGLVARAIQELGGQRKG